MRTVSNTRLAPAAALFAALALVAPAQAQAPPNVPATIFGTVTVEGAAARDGAVIRAYIDGKDCTQDGTKAAVRDGDVTHFVIPVVHETQVPGCGKVGSVITFTIDGAEASPGATWKDGPQEVNLQAGPGGSPVPTTPSPTVSTPSLPTPDDGEGFPFATATGVVAVLLGLAAIGAFVFRRKWYGKGAA
jgi:hypothetical protein